MLFTPKEYALPESRVAQGNPQCYNPLRHTKICPLQLLLFAPVVIFCLKAHGVGLQSAQATLSDLMVRKLRILVVFNYCWRVDV